MRTGPSTGVTTGWDLSIAPVNEEDATWNSVSFADCMTNRLIDYSRRGAGESGGSGAEHLCFTASYPGVTRN